jgi:hypothetical protein
MWFICKKNRNILTQIKFLLFFRENINLLMILNRMMLEEQFHVFKVKISIKIWIWYINLMNLRVRKA